MPTKFPPALKYVWRALFPVSSRTGGRDEEKFKEEMVDRVRDGLGRETVERYSPSPTVLKKTTASYFDRLESVKVVPSSVLSKTTLMDSWLFFSLWIAVGIESWRNNPSWVAE